MSPNRIFAVVNPASGNGRTRKEWPSLITKVEAHLGEFTWEWTEGPGHATVMAKQALQSGYTIVLSVGGDGTHQETANAFFNEQGCVQPEASLAILPRGTGSDFGKTLDIPKNPEKALSNLARRQTALIDGGRLRYRAPDGTPLERGFVNLASFGISGEVDVRVNRTSKALGGFLSFLWAALGALMSKKADSIRFSIDGGPWREAKTVLVVAANGQYFGGGMWVSPKAKPDDGLLDGLIAHDMSRSSLLLLLAKLYRGRHLPHPKLETFRAKTLIAESPGRVLLDVDGEPLGTLPIELKLVPKAINVFVGPGFQSLYE